MKIMFGKDIATKTKADISTEICENKYTPRLAIIQVGSVYESNIYVNKKLQFAKESMVETTNINLEYDESKNEHTIENEILELIKVLNSNKKINGIIVQLPLPKHVNVDKIMEEIDPLKDVDCFNPHNIGLLSTGKSKLKPCTPYGIMKMLKYNNIDITGKHCVIIGRSNIVGKPLSQLLLNENATVTVCHSKTNNIKDITIQADILISAVGIPNFVTKDMVKQDSIVIDVGINRLDGKLCGDVDFKNVSTICSHITPVPGGVGLTTVASLIENTLTAYKLQNNIE